jgi:hypothetical protein
MLGGINMSFKTDIEEAKNLASSIVTERKKYTNMIGNILRMSGLNPTVEFLEWRKPSYVCGGLITFETEKVSLDKINSVLTKLGLHAINESNKSRLVYYAKPDGTVIITINMFSKDLSVIVDKSSKETYDESYKDDDLIIDLKMCRWGNGSVASKCSKFMSEHKEFKKINASVYTYKSCYIIITESKCVIESNVADAIKAVLFSE